MNSGSSRGRSQRRHDPLHVLDYIATYQQHHAGRSPSQRQIQSGLQMSAPSTVHNLLHRLVQAGLLRITTHGRGLAADLAITELGHARLSQWRAGGGGGSAPPAPEHPDADQP